MPRAARTRRTATVQAAPPAIDAAQRKKLLAWYRRGARDLPWRRSADPYAVWVSEVMLQQTQVATVIPYFTRFMQRFPTIAALAEAEESAVLRMWEGLGYYRRARQLQRAAQQIVAEHGGEFPRDLDTVRSLPGIGRYTAGAILSIAHDERLPILEANTIRLWARLLAVRGDLRPAAAQEVLWHAAEASLPRRGSGVFNQALMELGSQVCLPREPRCLACPLAAVCAARQGGLVDRIPALARGPRIEAVREAALVVRQADRVLLLRCGEGERWAGLWDFPRFAVREEAEPLSAYLCDQLRRRTGIAARLGQPLAQLRHSVTRFRITLDCYAAVPRARSTARLGPDLAWVLLAELDSYPLCVTGRKLAQLVAGSGGGQRSAARRRTSAAIS